MLINIGWARAASTAFRQNFLLNHPGIVVASRDQPAHEGPAATILHGLKSFDDARFRDEAPAFRAMWSEYLGRTERLVCLTDEELSIGLPGRVGPAQLGRRCADLFPDARILAFVRDQPDAIGSFYGLSQRDAFQNQMPFAAWLDRYFLNPANGRGFAYLYAHAATLKAYADGRKRSDILVLHYDQLRDDPRGAYVTIAGWAGIDMQLCAALPNAVINASPNRPPEWCPASLAAVRALYEADNQLLAAEFETHLSRPMPRETGAFDAI